MYKTHSKLTKTKTSKESIKKNQDKYTQKTYPKDTYDNDRLAIGWLESLFDQNNINITEFLAWSEIIKTKRYQKINGLVIQGPTNTGKSQLLEILLNHIKPEEIPRQKDCSNFHLHQLSTATSVLFEEPCITRNNVGTWKLMFEGKNIKTD